MHNAQVERHPHTEFNGPEEIEIVCNLAYGVTTKKGIQQGYPDTQYYDQEPDDDKVGEVLLNASFGVNTLPDCENIAIDVYIPPAENAEAYVLRFTSAYREDEKLEELPEAFHATADYVAKAYPEKERLALMLLAAVYSNRLLYRELEERGIDPEDMANYVLDIYDNELTKKG